ncbi:MAG TPA: GGDEF domain-containing protein [Halothiobacillus sp.]|nr:GGDEF domain-containing protein [Halothiobacillus sp.]
MTTLSTGQVTIRIVVIIALAEFFIMLLFRMAPPHPYLSGPYMVAALDAILLGLISAPAIYFWVIKPFVNERDSALARLNHLALTDPLTELANRRLIMRDLAKTIAANARHHEYGAVLLLDLDGFKAVNDNFGHETGDAVLIAIAQRLRLLFREEDSIGRLGGDEFVVLLHRLGPELATAQTHAQNIANKIIDRISAPVFYQGETLHVGASIGIRMLGWNELVSDLVINDADTAMYLAKEAGRGRACFYEPSAKRRPLKGPSRP